MLKIIIISALFAGTMLFAKVSAEYSVNFVGMSMDYREYDNNGIIQDSESSGYTDLGGVEFAYKFNMQSESKLELNSISFTAMILDGSTHYIGSEINSPCNYYGCKEGTNANKIYDFNLDFAHTYQQTPNYKIIVSLGLGYRFWRRELSAQQIEDYKWYSLRPSLAFSYDYKNLNISPRFEYQYGLRPRMSATGFNKEFKLGGANIIQFTLPVEYTINRSFSVYGAYTYQYQKIRESNVVYDNSGIGYLEPQSKAYNEYMKFGIIFKY